MDKILKQLKTNPSSVKDNDILLAASALKIDLTGRKGVICLSRIPGLGTPGELWVRNSLTWLRTIPLSIDEGLVILHAEAGIYAEGKKGKCSADLIGLHRKTTTTQFAVAELKYGKSGDNLMYAYAEGLRNLSLHLQGLSRLEAGWRESLEHRTKGEQNAWRQCNPFRVSKKTASLFIIGDHEWSNTPKNKRLAALLPKIVNLNGIAVEISVYSTRKGAKCNSAPYALLPMKKI